MHMKKITVGILAHVDAGKTTTLETLLKTQNKIKSEAFLDHNSQEKKRGITIYDKEAHFTWKDAQIHVIDTPGSR